MHRSVMLLALVIGLPTAADAQAGPKGCDSPESHQLDFWLGKWEVHANGSDKIIAHSLIEKKYMGCAVRENWMPVGVELTGGGGSLSGYDPGDKQWHQTWYDSAGSRVMFDGGFADGVMAITGNWPSVLGPGKDALIKMSYQRQPDGQVRQWGMASTDGGKTWAPNFDLLYRHVDAFPPFK